MLTSYEEIVTLLNLLRFDEFYKNQISTRNYKINYGERKKDISYSSVKNAAEKYIYDSNKAYMVSIDEQLPILSVATSIDDHELILQCIEVFDWGGVQKSNILKAIELHREKSLGSYLLKCKAWFEDDNTLILQDSNIVWSSGWTKVYSLMFEKTTIYDSRVAAFINFMMVSFYYHLNTEVEKEKLKNITMNFVSFKGTESRKRRVGKVEREKLGIKLRSTKNHDNFLANKVASWLLRYITELEFSSNSQADFRKIDKAAFMLGFDISQIDPLLNFE